MGLIYKKNIIIIHLPIIYILNGDFAFFLYGKKRILGIGKERSLSYCLAVNYTATSLPIKAIPFMKEISHEHT